MRVKNDHGSEFSNLSNWKEEAWKKSDDQIWKKFVFNEEMTSKMKPATA